MLKAKIGFKLPIVKEGDFDPQNVRQATSKVPDELSRVVSQSSRSSLKFKRSSSAVQKKVCCRMLKALLVVTLLLSPVFTHLKRVPQL